MAQFIPKFITPEVWQQMTAQNVYAIKLSGDTPARFRFGMGLGLYIEISKSSQGHVINVLDFESGEPALAGKLNPDVQVVVGRTSECQIKIAQPIMSRQHLELKVWNGQILVAKDLSSTNGTFMWNEIPLINLTLPVSEQQSVDVLEKRFGIDVTPLLNEYSQSKGS